MLCGVTEASAPSGSLTYGGYPLIRFTSPAVGWRIADQRVYRSKDAGHSWQAVLTTNSYGTRNDGWSWFFDDNSAVVVGGDLASGDRFYRTEDAGTSWRETAIPSGAMPFRGTTVRLFSFASPSQGWVLVEQGPSLTALETLTLYRTTDGGEHWSVVTRSDHDSLPDQLPLNARLQHLTFANASTGWATGQMVGGGAVTAVPTAYVTTDGGSTWKPQDLPPVPGLDLSRAAPQAPLLPAPGDEVLLPVVTLPERTRDGGFGGHVVMYRSGDSGLTWSCAIVLPETLPIGADVAGGVVDADHWWLAVGRGISVTSDAGRTWVRLRPELDKGGRFIGMSFGDLHHAHAVIATDSPTAAEHFRYLESADGGATWHPAPEVPGT